MPRRRPMSHACLGFTQQRATPASSGGPTLPAKTPTVQRNWRRAADTTPASRATRHSSRRSVRSTAATSTATSNSPARWPSDTALSAATRWPPTSTVCSPQAGWKRRWQSPNRRSRAAPHARQPVLDLVRRCGSPGWRSHGWTRGGRWPPGTKASRSSASIGCVLRGLPRTGTRPACTPPTANRTAALVVFRRGRHRVPPGGQHPGQLSSRSPACRPCSNASTVTEPAATLLAAMAQQALERAPRPGARRPRSPASRDRARCDEAQEVAAAGRRPSLDGAADTPASRSSSPAGSRPCRAAACRPAD